MTRISGTTARRNKPAAALVESSRGLERRPVRHFHSAGINSIRGLDPRFRGDDAEWMQGQLLVHPVGRVETAVMPISLDEVSRRLRPVFQRNGVVRAVIFGSAARGELSRRSDVDILVVQRTDKRFLDRYDPLLREIAQAIPGRDVDLLIYTPEELEALSVRPFIARALREGKVLYERE